jgi:hypothetical protein
MFALPAACNQIHEISTGQSHNYLSSYLIKFILDRWNNVIVTQTSIEGAVFISHTL